jgi:hypothetical protein
MKKRIRNPIPKTQAANKPIAAEFAIVFGPSIVASHYIGWFRA